MQTKRTLGSFSRAGPAGLLTLVALLVLVSGPLADRLTHLTGIEATTSGFSVLRLVNPDPTLAAAGVHPGSPIQAVVENQTSAAADYPWTATACSWTARGSLSLAAEASGPINLTAPAQSGCLLVLALDGRTLSLQLEIVK